MIGSRSRYNLSARIIRRNGAGQLLEFERFDLRPTLMRIVFADNREYVPANDDNWSRIAWKSLGDGRLYWIIADFSQVIDPFSELTPQNRTSYMTQLSATLTAGVKTQMTVVRTKGLKQGMLLKVEDLNPANPNSITVAVLSVNTATGVVTFSPVTVPVGGIVNTLSRVSKVYQTKPKLTVPTLNRAVFDALDFSNPLNTLVP